MFRKNVTRVNVMKKLFNSFLIIYIIVSLSGCGEADMEGIILEVTENELLLSKNLTPNEYEEIKNESATKLQNEDVHGERESLNLIDLTYNNTDEFTKGDEVDVWIEGDILESYPAQAKAKKISIK